MQADLFTYPAHAGFKERGGASEDAARAIEKSGKAATCRREVLDVLERHPRGLTAPETRRKLNNRYSLNCVRSRLTELSQKDDNGNQFIEKTGERRQDPESRHAIAVYRSLVFNGR